MLGRLVDKFFDQQTLSLIYFKTGSVTPSRNWPEMGHVIYNRVHARYAAGLPAILQGVTIDFKPGMKVIYSISIPSFLYSIKFHLRSKTHSSVHNIDDDIQLCECRNPF